MSDETVSEIHTIVDQPQPLPVALPRAVDQHAPISAIL
jgi:hypothetical protein